jgi:hypothetical protein
LGAMAMGAVRWRAACCAMARYVCTMCGQSQFCSTLLERSDRLEQRGKNRVDQARASEALNRELTTKIDPTLTRASDALSTPHSWVSGYCIRPYSGSPERITFCNRIGRESGGDSKVWTTREDEGKQYRQYGIAGGR